MVNAAPAIAKGRALIVCDADEVLFYFLRGLEAFLSRQALYLDLKSFALTGNIRRRDDNEPLQAGEVKILLEAFFASETERLDPVESAATSLAALARTADIVVLSNVPPAQADARKRALARAGMDYPLIANAGPKGGAVKTLAADRAGPVFFLDDLPPHIDSVAAAVPHATCIHYVADARLSRLVATPPAAAHRGEDWPGIRAFIEGRL